MSTQTSGPSRALEPIVGAGVGGQDNLYSLSPGVQQELRKPEVAPCGWQHMNILLFAVAD